jgi:hypothetical protein
MDGLVMLLRLSQPRRTSIYACHAARVRKEVIATKFSELLGKLRFADQRIAALLERLGKSASAAINPGHTPLVDRARHTNVGNPDKWRTP